MEASSLLRPSHPLHHNFKAWVISKANGDARLTVRQARKYLQKFPALKGLGVRAG